MAKRKKAELKPENAKLTLTKLTLDNAPKAPKGQRYEYMDAGCRGLALRVTEKGAKSFVLRARFPNAAGRPVFARRALGRYPDMTLDEAHEAAEEWRKLLRKGLDPRREERRKRAAEQRERSITFGAVAADFMDRHTSKLRKAKQAKAIINAEFVKRWKDWPIVDVGPLEAAQAIRAIVARGKRYQAHNAFGYLRRLFNWAIAAGEYGIEVSPVSRLRPAELIGAREPRVRVLRDEELRRVWRAAYAIPYPYGPLVQFLILTGQREREVADMTWAEVDLDKQLWTIPAERMKSDRAHEIPLAPAALSLLEALPDWKGGDYVFSTTAGKKPVNGFSKIKRRLDQWAAIVHAYDCEQAGKDVPKEKLERWVFHDLRRTMRTHLSALPVQDMVRELVIAHARPGLHRVYDQHGYQDEKRQCLELWEARLKGILAPPTPRGGNVIALRA